MISLKPQHLELIKAIVREYLSGYEVRAFGSRVTGNLKPHSDLDLLVVSKEAVPFRTLALVREAFIDSDLPFRVDVVTGRDIDMASEVVISSTPEKTIP